MNKSFVKIFIATIVYILFFNMASLAQGDSVIAKQEKMEGLIKYQNDLKPINLTIEDALKRAMESNQYIDIKKEQVKEKKLKLDDVQNRRLLLLFKFVNPLALENSAKYSLSSSQYQLNTTINTVMLDVSTKYYKVLTTMMFKNIAEEFLKQGEISLHNNEELLKSGQSTKFDVAQTEVFVSGLKQKCLEADIEYMVSSVELAQYLNIKELNTKIIPVPEASSSDINIKLLDIIPDNILLTDCINKALQIRPEMKDLENQIKSLEEMKNASLMDDIKVETLNSQINQLKNSLELTQNNIKISLTQALLKFIGSKNQIEVANQKYQLSIKALEQAKITKEEGFGTNKNVLDAQVDLALSKNKYVESIISCNLAQINLLYQIGVININTITDNKAIDIQ